MNETREIRLKRLKMRSIRRGIKEMDLILSAFAETQLNGLNADQLDLYERLLDEPDQELYTWVSGQVPAAEVYAELIQNIARNYQK